MKSYVAAVDAGTGGIRCAIYDSKGNIISQDYREISTRYGSCGQAVQNPSAFIDSAIDAVRRAVAKCTIDASAIRALSFAGTQTTFAAVDKNGHFLTDIILWQDMRGTDVFPHIRKKLSENNITEDDLYRKTFRPLDTLLAGAKLYWIRENQPDVYRKINKLINPQSILLRAFGAEEYTVDCTDTGWWMSHDAVTMERDETLSSTFGFDERFFPELRGSCECVGRLSPCIASMTGLSVGIPLFQGAVDQCCAALGAGNYGDAGFGTMCLGTAGVISTYSDEPSPDPMCRYYVIHYPTGGYMSELAVPVAASAFRWVRDMLYPAKAFSHENIYSLMDSEASDASIGAGGLVFLPHLSGSIYPRMDTTVRGGFVGASLNTSRADLVRAAMEGICYGMRHILESGASHFKTLRLLGGASRSELWNQMQADVYNCPVETIVCEEASALGAAMIAATGSGLYPSLKDAVKGMSRIKRRYEPDPVRASRYSEVYNAWLKCMDDLSPSAFPALEYIRTGNKM